MTQNDTATLSGLEFNREIRIPVPWGHLAAKQWGPDDGQPVLALHGWDIDETLERLDNAGSFDRLALFLPSTIRLVCLDFPGNGHSTAYPRGTLLNHFDCVCHVKLVFDYFHWKKITIIAHSMGGITALCLASWFPEMVDKLVCLDTVKQTSFKAEDYPELMRSVITRFHGIVKRMEKGPPTPMTYEQARAKLVSDYNGSIDERDADVLLIRGLKKVNDNQWVFTRDLRSIIQLFTSDEQLSVAIRNIRCPFLFVKSKFSLLYTNPEFVEFFNNVYVGSSKGFRLVEVEGNHHAHLSLPHIVAPHINNFLFSVNSQL